MDPFSDWKPFDDVEVVGDRDEGGIFCPSERKKLSGDCWERNVAKVLSLQNESRREHQSNFR